MSVVTKESGIIPPCQHVFISDVFLPAYTNMCVCVFFSTKEPGSVAPCQHCGCISNQGNQFGSKGPRQSSLTVFVSGFVFRFCVTLIVFVFAFFTSGICTCICIYHNVFVSVTSHRFGAAVLSIFCDPPPSFSCNL